MCQDNSACGKRVKASRMKSVLVAHLWEMESEVCNQVFPRAHIEPELPLEVHPVGHIGLVAWDTKPQSSTWIATDCNNTKLSV